MAGPVADAGDVPVTDEELRQLLLDTKVIAVVGLSANPDRPSNQVAWYLHHQGYRLFGVNPRCPELEVFGVPMLPSLDQVPEPIDLVDVFRRPKYTPEVARAAVAAGAGALWLQLGISTPRPGHRRGGPPAMSRTAASRSSKPGCWAGPVETADDGSVAMVGCSWWSS